MNNTSIETSRRIAGALPVTRIGAVVGAGLLGLFIVLGVGFAPLAVVHNAVHDVRHSAAFPCH